MNRNIITLLALFVLTACEEIDDELKRVYTPFVAEQNGSVVNETGQTYSDGPIGIQNDTVFTVKGVSFKMIKVEGGTFTMGSDDPEDLNAHPAHQVTLSTYFIGETEVTHDLFVAVTGKNYDNYANGNVAAAYLDYTKASGMAEELKELTGFNFCLPTEAQWEFAARGGNKSRGYLYAGGDDVYKVAATGPSTVRTKLPNELGIYDMTGNMWEYCYGWWGPYTSSPKTNPMGASHPDESFNRIVRGSAKPDKKNSRIALRQTDSYVKNTNAAGMRLAIR